MANEYAVIFVAWGERATVEALEAATRFPDSYGCSKFVITDVEAEPSPSVSIIQADYSLPSYLRKIEALVRFSPSGFDVVLYLDNDVKVLGDISLLFDKAQEFGLALAIAPTYLLDHYHDFSRVLLEEKVAPRGQLQYNSGVIAYSPGTRVSKLFQEWLRLAHQYSENTLYDQVFLSLALEKNGFQPYVLSKNYNLRGRLEPVIGEVRVWHSRLPVPENLNAFSNRHFPPRLLAKGRIRDPFLWEYHSHWFPLLVKRYVLDPLYSHVRSALTRR